MVDKRRKVQIGDANFADYQFVEQRLEQHLSAALVLREGAHRHARLAACPGGFLELQRSDSPHIGAATTRTDVLFLKCAPSSLGTDLSINNFIRFFCKHCLCSSEHLDRLVTRHRGVTFQEIVKPITGFQILDQDTYGNPSPEKHRSSAKDFRVFAD